MKNPLKTLEANTVGRDFVIGDLHGCYEIFQNLLKNINFDYTKDRMICVGDLVDRGPDSLKCLSLILEPWFHSVLANHEQMMLDRFEGGYMGRYWYRNGGQWGMEAYNDYESMKHDKSRIPADSSVELIDLLPLVEELPFMITVNTKAGKKFHVIHAELPDRVGTITDMELTVPEEVAMLATVHRGEGDAFLWNRFIFAPFYRSELKNKRKIVATLKYTKATEIFNDKLSHIISGHTVLQQPMTIVGQTNIDTCAYDSYPEKTSSSGKYVQKPPKWAALTCVELDTWTFYKTTETTFKEIKPVVITEKDLLKQEKSL
jgi:hypothetical protein